MHKSFWIILSIAGLVMYLAWARQEITKKKLLKPGSDSLEVRSVTKTNDEQMIQAEETRPGNTPDIPTQPLIVSQIKGLKEFYPYTENVRSEIRENPHQTPESLVKFAEKLGPLVEKASNNRKASKILAHELGDCVSSESVIVSARALCLSMIEDLVSAHPQLKNEALKVRSGAAVDVIELDNRRKAFLK